MTKDNATALLALAARCEAATGPDRELDAAIWLASVIGATREQWDYTHEASGRLCHMDETRDASRRLIIVPAYTASLDAAMTLVGNVGVLITLSEIKGDGMPMCVVGTPENANIYMAVAQTMQTALCAAALRARAAVEGE